MPTSDRQPSRFARREFLKGISATLATAAASLPAAALARPALAGQWGVTTGSFTRHLSAEKQPGKLRLLDLPKIMREELDLRVIDLMTATLPTLAHDYLKQLREAAEREGCLLTNLKMNQRGLDLGHESAAERQRAIEEYKITIEAASVLGLRWVRPLPGSRRPDLKILAAAYRELIDFAAPRGISLLVENFGWLASDPAAIPEIIAAVGPGIAAQPDTGNWSNNVVRYEGLSRAFRDAASCDFKARPLGPSGEHPEFDLQRCFDIGWDAGFRGPWCFEYQHPDLAKLFRDLGILRDRLRQWMKARQS
jgi:sugar phosphate isomerase/epimerase